MKLNNFAPLILLILICTGCSADIEMPTVVEVSSYKISDEQGTLVKAVFSEEMNRVSCENAFLLSTSEGAVKGIFSWDASGKSFVFNPIEHLASGMYCTVTIARSASDISGNKIKTEFLYSFYAGADIVSPRVVSVIPGIYSENFHRDGIISIKFSEPMDRASVEKDIMFYPSHRIIYNWIDPETVNIIPVLPYDFMTDYTCTIGKESSDLSGNMLIEEKKIFFTAGREFIRPYITELTGSPQADPDASGNLNWIAGGNFSEWSGVGKNTALNFIFSEPVDRQSFTDAFKISPVVEFAVSWITDAECIVNFHPGLIPGIKYELRILKSLKDISGNETPDSLIFYFNVNSANGSSPEIISSNLLSSDGAVTQILNADAVSNINISPFTDGKCRAGFVFNHVMDQVSVHDKIIIEKMNGLFTGDASVAGYTWNEAGDTLALELVSVKEKNLYKITISGGENGIKSRDGSYLNEERIFYFTINGAQ